jgi:hypothetical protein
MTPRKRIGLDQNGNPILFLEPCQSPLPSWLKPLFVSELALASENFIAKFLPPSDLFLGLAPFTLENMGINMNEIAEVFS